MCPPGPSLPRQPQHHICRTAAAAAPCIFDDRYYSHLCSQAGGRELILSLQSWGAAGGAASTGPPSLIPVPSSPGDTDPPWDVDLCHCCVTNPRCEQLVNGPDLQTNMSLGGEVTGTWGAHTHPFNTPLQNRAGTNQRKDLDTHCPDNTRQHDTSICLPKAYESLKASSSRLQPQVPASHHIGDCFPVGTEPTALSNPGSIPLWAPHPLSHEKSSAPTRPSCRNAVGIYYADSSESEGLTANYNQ